MKENTNPKFIAVIGASAGGLNALTELVKQLPDDMDAAVCIVLHLSSKGISNYLVNQLQQHTGLPCELAVHDKPIFKNHIYVAPPDQHFIVKKDKIAIGRGPKENRWKPSIDVLFRSAAVAYNSNTIGIVLTGLLDDGTAGMSVIKRCGGVTMVQDPNEAEYPDMPLSVLDNLQVDHCIRLSEMGETILKITKTKRKPVTPDEEAVAESTISEKAAIGIDVVASLGGEHSIFSCPDCGGGLWEITNGNIKHFRCHIGHSYSEKDLILKQTETLETTLWVALRMMEERRNMLLKMQDQNQRKGLARIAAENYNRAEEILLHINKLRDVLFATQAIDG